MAELRSGWRTSASRCASVGCANEGVATASIAAVSNGQSAASRFNVSNIFNESFLAFAGADAATEILTRLMFAEQLSRVASFSVSGSAASGLLLFSWDGGPPLSD